MAWTIASGVSERPHRNHTPAMQRNAHTYGLCAPTFQRLPPLAWVGAVLPVPLPLPDLTHSSSGRGQEAPAPQDTTHPGKTIKNKNKIKRKGQKIKAPG